MEIIISSLTLLLFLSHFSVATADADTDNVILLTPKMYSKIFVDRRKDQMVFIKRILNLSYEKSYKMLNIALEKIIEMITKNNNTLINHQFDALKGFTNEKDIQEAISLLLENICFAGEIILHFPEISSRILKKFPTWKNMFNWGIHFVSKFKGIIDKNTIKMLSLFKQEINEHERSEDYTNPYREREKHQIENEVKKIKKKKQIKKGPQLVSRDEL